MLQNREPLFFIVPAVTIKAFIILFYNDIIKSLLTRYVN